MRTKRLFPRLFRLFLPVVCLFCLLALPVAADAGDYDQIDNYVITVDPRQDGSADITYAVDWQVIGGGSGDYLSWVRIGLANSHMDSLEILTPDTVARIDYDSDGGSYAKLVFKNRYYAPAVAEANGSESRVHFEFKVHQSHLFSRNDDNTASFEFSPGWFDDLCVEKLQIRWRNYEGFVADNTAVDGDYLTWDFGPLAHGQRATARVTVPVTTAAAYDETQALTPEDWAPEETESTYHISDSFYIGPIILVFVALLMVAIIFASRIPRWCGGFGAVYPPDDDYCYYSDGMHTIRLAHGVPPPAGHHLVDPPPGAFHTGGGSTRGGGAGRHGGGGSSRPSCACACASSCACACACAGGGRAGCSVKNFYRIRLTEPTAAPEQTSLNNEEEPNK